jgi:hypothetical protein
MSDDSGGVYFDDEGQRYVQSIADAVEGGAEVTKMVNICIPDSGNNMTCVVIPDEPDMSIFDVVLEFFNRLGSKHE